MNTVSTSVCEFAKLTVMPVPPEPTVTIKLLETCVRSLVSLGVTAAALRAAVIGSMFVAKSGSAALFGILVLPQRADGFWVGFLPVEAVTAHQQGLEFWREQVED